MLSKNGNLLHNARQVIYKGDNNFKYPNQITFIYKLLDN
jgi:hypothetical protein